MRFLIRNTKIKKSAHLGRIMKRRTHDFIMGILALVVLALMMFEIGRCQPFGC